MAGRGVGYRGRMPTHARDRLLTAAAELFYAERIQAVGVERLLAVSWVGRASFYRHFAGKDALVAAVLQRQGEQWLAWLEAAVAEHGGGPLADRARSREFHGCAFVNAMAETADPNSEVYRLAEAHKRRVTGYIEQLLKAAGYERHEALAQQFVLLMDGATVTAMRERTGAPALRACEMAQCLLG